MTWKDVGSLIGEVLRRQEALFHEAAEDPHLVGAAGPTPESPSAVRGPFDVMASISVLVGRDGSPAATDDHLDFGDHVVTWLEREATAVAALGEKALLALISSATHRRGLQRGCHRHRVQAMPRCPSPEDPAGVCPVAHSR